MAAASEAEVDNHAMLGFDPDQYDEILGLKGIQPSRHGNPRTWLPCTR